MPSPEYGGPEHHSRPTDPADLYELAARFPSERTAHRAYVRAQEAVFRAPCDLSVFRFLLDRASHVAVIGITPPEELDRGLRRILRTGDLALLPDGIVRLLWERRIQANREGAWVERHYRPGRPPLRRNADRLNEECNGRSNVRTTVRQFSRSPDVHWPRPPLLIVAGHSSEESTTHFPP